MRFQPPSQTTIAATAQINPPTWRAVDETIRVDGYGFVKKAMAMTGASAAMEFAASLMTQAAARSSPGILRDSPIDLLIS